MSVLWRCMSQAKLCALWGSLLLLWWAYLWQSWDVWGEALQGAIVVGLGQVICNPLGRAWPRCWHQKPCLGAAKTLEWQLLQLLEVRAHALRRNTRALIVLPERVHPLHEQPVQRYHHIISNYSNIQTHLIKKKIWIRSYHAVSSWKHLRFKWGIIIVLIVLAARGTSFLLTWKNLTISLSLCFDSRLAALDVENWGHFTLRPRTVTLKLWRPFKFTRRLYHGNLKLNFVCSRALKCKDICNRALNQMLFCHHPIYVGASIKL